MWTRPLGADPQKDRPFAIMSKPAIKTTDFDKRPDKRTGLSCSHRNQRRKRRISTNGQTFCGRDHLRSYKRADPQTDRPFAIMSKPAIKTTERDKETDLLDLDKWTDLFWTRPLGADPQKDRPFAITQKDRPFAITQKDRPFAITQKDRPFAIMSKPAIKTTDFDKRPDKRTGLSCSHRNQRRKRRISTKGQTFCG